MILELVRSTIGHAREEVCCYLASDPSSILGRSTNASPTPPPSELQEVEVFTYGQGEAEGIQRLCMRLLRQGVQASNGRGQQIYSAGNGAVSQRVGEQQPRIYRNLTITHENKSSDP